MVNTMSINVMLVVELMNEETQEANIKCDDSIKH